MKVLAIIPARGGSKGVPKKNIKELAGKPLVYYTFEQAKKSKLLSEIIISTDDLEIVNIAKNYNIKAPFIRPDYLAQDDTPTIEVLKHAIEFYQKQNVSYDAICILQPTTPFRDENFIDIAIEKFIETNADTLISVLPVPHQYNPHWIFEEVNNHKLKIATGEKNIIPRRQELPKSYFRDGSIYLIKTDIIINKDTLFGEYITFIESSADDFVNIDTIEDWEKAEQIILRNYTKYD